MHSMINEDAARRSQQAYSFSDYKEGSETDSYDRMISLLRSEAKEHKRTVDKSFHTEIDRLVERYALLLASRINEWNTRRAEIPSPMITGSARYPAERMKRKSEIMMRHDKQTGVKLDAIRRSIFACGTRIGSAHQQAPALLQQKLEELNSHHQHMKLANAQARAQGQDALYTSSTLKNSRAEIRRMQQRLDSLHHIEALGVLTYYGVLASGESFTFIQDGNHHFYYFEFSSKPSEPTRILLKKHGFHYSPSSTRWQRIITGNATFAVRRIFACCPTPPTRQES